MSKDYLDNWEERAKLNTKIIEQQQNKTKMKKALERIKVLEDELALLKADLELKKEPLICNHPAMSFEVYPTDLGEMLSLIHI